jgi:hypothetical protein
MSVARKEAMPQARCSGQQSLVSEEMLPGLLASLLASNIKEVRVPGKSYSMSRCCASSMNTLHGADHGTKHALRLC